MYVLVDPKTNKYFQNICVTDINFTTSLTEAYTTNTRDTIKSIQSMLLDQGIDSTITTISQENAKLNTKISINSIKTKSGKETIELAYRISRNNFTIQDLLAWTNGKQAEFVDIICNQLNVFDLPE